MSTKELAHSIIDDLSEEQLSAFITLFGAGHDIPNEETEAALAEYEEMKNDPQKYKRYHSFDEVLKEVFAET